jgi:hypothetical protein
MVEGGLLCLAMVAVMLQCWYYMQMVPRMVVPIACVVVGRHPFKLALPPGLSAYTACVAEQWADVSHQVLMCCVLCKMLSDRMWRTDAICMVCIDQHADPPSTFMPHPSISCRRAPAGGRHRTPGTGTGWQQEFALDDAGGVKL